MENPTYTIKDVADKGTKLVVSVEVSFNGQKRTSLVIVNSSISEEDLASRLEQRAQIISQQMIRKPADLQALVKTIETMEKPVSNIEAIKTLVGKPIEVQLPQITPENTTPDTPETGNADTGVQ